MSLVKQDRSKREQYTSHACHECHRRKVKCSGGSICSNCERRGIQCAYEEYKPRGRKPKKRDHEILTSDLVSSQKNRSNKSQQTASLKGQLAQLQRKVEELCKGRSLNEDRESKAESLYLTDTEARATLTTVASSPSDEEHTPISSASLRGNSAHSPQYYFAILQTTDTFVAKSTSISGIANSSQIRALQRLSNDRESSRPQVTLDKRSITIQLPESNVLFARIEAFFQEFGCFWPFLHQQRVRDCLFTVLSTVKSGQNDNEILVTRQNCKIVAILLNILAFADLMEEVFAKADYSPGSQSYCKGLDLMENFGMLYDNSLETIIYHTIAASFFLAAEKLNMALQSASQGFHIARCLELNNQKRWPDSLNEDIACRQSLWWTLYFLDKRITQKIGITYSLRDNECGVPEFVSSRSETTLPPHQEMLQSMISFSQLWVYIWDHFFSPRASMNSNDWEELELTDTRIMLAYRQLPSNLQWESQKILEYFDQENETQIRRRLLVYLRFSFLRLSIRHNPLQSDNHNIQRRENCISLCRFMVEAVQAYTDTFGSHKPSGYFLTSALVESLYWVEIELRQKNPVLLYSELEEIKALARRLLYDLSLSIGAAARAYDSLSDILARDIWEELLQAPEVLPDFSEVFNDVSMGIEESTPGSASGTSVPFNNLYLDLNWEC